MCHSGGVHWYWGGYAGMETEGIWEISVPSQFCCEPRTALKTKSKKNWIVLLRCKSFFKYILAQFLYQIMFLTDILSQPLACILMFLAVSFEEHVFKILMKFNLTNVCL